MTRQELGGLLFEWDERKEARNIEKHGVTFQDALLAFFDPDALIEPSEAFDGEHRFELIGIARDLLLLFVAYRERNHNGQRNNAHHQRPKSW